MFHKRNTSQIYLGNLNFNKFLVNAKDLTQVKRLDIKVPGN